MSVAARATKAFSAQVIGAHRVLESDNTAGGVGASTECPCQREMCARLHVVRGVIRECSVQSAAFIIWLA